MDTRQPPATATDRGKIRALPWALAGTVLNSIFYLRTFGGPTFILFLGELGLPTGQIGIVLSLFPFCGLLALTIAPAAAHLGRKRLFLAAYGIRKLVIALLMLLPGIVIRAGRPAAFLFLYSVIIVFAVLPALAETAYYPWFQEFVPNSVRGKFTAWSTVAGLTASGVALAIAGSVPNSGTGLQRYTALIGAGSGVGFLGVLLMIKVPGGGPACGGGAGTRSWSALRGALRDVSFTTYLAGMAGTALGTLMLVNFLPLYLTERLGLPPAAVVRLGMVMSVGGAIVSLGWGWLSDRFGSRPVLVPTTALLLACPLGWLLLPRNAANMVLWCSGLYLLFGIASHGNSISAGRTTDVFVSDVGSKHFTCPGGKL